MVVLGFNSSDDATMAKEFMEECDFTFRTVLDSGQEALNVSYSGYKASCVPLHYIIDREGKIALTQPGFERGYGKILGTLARLGVDTGVEPLPANEPVRTVRKAEKTIPPVGPKVRGKGLIEGTVVDPTGKPISDVAIRLRCTEPSIRKATSTDGEGLFKFRRLPAGEYLVTLEWDATDETKDVERKVSLEDGQKIELELEQSR